MNEATSQTYINSTPNLSNVKKKDINKKERPLLYLLIASISLFVLQKLFDPIILLNKPSTAILLVVLVLTFLSLFFTRKYFLLLGLTPKDELKARLLIVGYNIFKYVVAFGIVYYFSISLLFNVCAKHLATLGPTEFYTIPITQINQGTSRSAPSVYFYFNQKFNTISSSHFHEVLKHTEDRFKPNLHIQVECRKSILNTYLVDSYEILQ